MQRRLRPDPENQENKMMTRYFSYAMILAVAALAGCASTPVDPGLLNNARFAIEQAETAGAQEYAPLELRQSRERLRAAEAAIEAREGERVMQLADESEILAQLALARTRASHARQELEQASRNMQRLEQDLVETFGEGVLQR